MTVDQLIAALDRYPGGTAVYIDTENHRELADHVQREAFPVTLAREDLTDGVVIVGDGSNVAWL